MPKLVSAARQCSLAISSRSTLASSRDSSPPPYCFGHSATAQPRSARVRNRLYETRSHRWRDCVLAADDGVKLLPGNCEALRCVGNGQSQILDVLLHQAARMRRILHGHIGLLMVIRSSSLDEQV